MCVPERQLFQGHTECYWISQCFLKPKLLVIHQYFVQYMSVRSMQNGVNTEMPHPTTLVRVAKSVIFVQRMTGQMEEKTVRTACSILHYSTVSHYFLGSQHRYPLLRPQHIILPLMSGHATAFLFMVDIYFSNQLAQNGSHETIDGFQSIFLIWAAQFVYFSCIITVALSHALPFTPYISFRCLLTKPMWFFPFRRFTALWWHVVTDLRSESVILALVCKFAWLNSL